MRSQEEKTALSKAGKAEAKIYHGVYDVLMAGMVASSALYAVGMVLALIHPSTIQLTRAYILRNYNVTTMIHGLAHFRPGAIFFLATALLILTPVTRVVISIYAFYTERNMKYVVVTGIVFLVIIATVILGRMGLQ
ncbi:MAG: DUF1634 domain-containing protein [Terriglobia bacterium]